MANHPRELRIAVAMRGGVSLAVWMGGACSEIVRLRNARPGGSDPYSQLLDILGYDKVTVDVISGSSAGGLNGVLLALNLAYGMPFGARARNLWLELGDLEQLSREPEEKAPVSLLFGDDDGGRGFYGRLRNAIRTLLEEAPDDHESERNIRLVLTATRLHPRGVRVYETLGTPLQASQAKAHFLFQHRAVDGGSPVAGDFPPGAEEQKQVSDLLAYAARTTSSFPAAFPPAMIRVDRGDAPFDDRDFQGLCSETGAGDNNGAAVELIDGGVLDNIPVAWAIRGIASAPSERPVDRWLLYLQPVEPEPRDGSETPPTQRRVTRLVRLLLKSASRRMDSESLLDDAEEMRAAEATVRRLRGVAAAGIPSDPGSVLDNPERYAAYRDLVGMAEGARLAQLTQEPGSVLGPDPLPLPTDRPLNEMDPPVAAEVLRGLGDTTITCPLALPEGTPPVPVGIRTPFGIARTVALLLDWVRAAETYGQLSRRSSQELRDQLFSARLAAELLVAARDRMILRRLRDARDAADVVDIARRAAWRLNEAVPPGWKVPTGGTWRDWADRLRDLAEQPLPDQAPEGWPERVLAPFWDELADIGVSVGKALDRSKPGPPGFDMLRVGALAEAADGRGPDGVTTMSRALAAAELLLGPVRSDPFTEPTDMKFHAITTSRQNPAEGQVFGRPLRSHERADRKLSGNQLVNFAAFLSARWRHTDWTWGRLDAVPSLVELMHADSGRVAERLERFTDEELLERLERLYVTDAAEASPGTAAGRLATRWAALGVTTGDVRERFVKVVTDRLQQEVFAEELPVLVKLSGRGGDRDLPPRADDLTELPPVDVATDAGRIADVGDETLRVLLRRWHVRRTAVRIGMVGWRAVQPAGEKLLARLARAAFGVIKPVALMPALAAVASPIGGITAALGSWLLVAAVAGTWSNPVIQPVLAVGFALAFGIAAWRQWGASGWTVAASAAGGAVFAVLGGLLLVALGLNQLWDSSALRYGAIVLGAVAAIVPFVWLLASRGPGVRLLGWMLLSLLAAGAVGVALSTVPDLVSRLSGGTPAEELPLDGSVGWLSGPTLGLLTLYAVLSIPALLLTYFFPAAPRR